MDVCEHNTVVKDPKDGHHFCRKCGEEFLPASVVADADRVADAVAATAAALLWDFHERAVQKYGADVARAVAPDSELVAEHAHQYAEGVCECGDSIFLGASEPKQIRCPGCVLEGESHGVDCEKDG